MSNLNERVEKMKKAGMSEKNAVDAIKKAEADMKKNPNAYLQPFTTNRYGNSIPNKEFNNHYGDPSKAFKDVGSANDKFFQEEAEEQKDREKYESGQKKNFMK